MWATDLTNMSRTDASTYLTSSIYDQIVGKWYDWDEITIQNAAQVSIATFQAMYPLLCPDLHSTSPLHQ